MNSKANMSKVNKLQGADDSDSFEFVNPIKDVHPNSQFLSYKNTTIKMKENEKFNSMQGTYII